MKAAVLYSGFFMDKRCVLNALTTIFSTINKTSRLPGLKVQF